MLVYVTITCPSDRITFGAYPRKEVITMRVGREINFLDTPPSDSITGAMLKNNSITNNKLSPGSVSGDKIDDYSINERHFNNDAVSSRAIATGGVDTRNIKSGALIISHMSAQFREFIENRGGLGGIKPAHHASTHGYGGLDRILPRDIGAAQREGESGVDFNTGALTATREVTGRSLHSQTDVTATQNIEAATDLIFGHELRTREFLEGILGFGFRSDQKGNVEAQSLKLRTFLETPELVKNQIRVIGTQAWLSESGVIARVSANPFLATGLTTADGRRLGTHYTGDYFVSFHDENANKWFRRDDILRGIYNYDSGFYTVFLRVMVCLSSGYVVRPLNGHAPTAEMVLVRQGNFTDPARQGAIYMDSAEGYIRVLGGMNSTEITNENLYFQAGNLRSLREMGITDMPPVGVFTRAGVFKGLSASDVTGAVTDDQLGGLAYEDMIETAQLGSTVIQGGHVNTELIDTVAIAAQAAFINALIANTAFINKLVANKALINDLEVRRLRTAKEGRRVEITPEVSSVDLYDYYGRKVVTLYDGSGGDGYDAKIKVINPLNLLMYSEFRSDRAVFRDMSGDGKMGSFSYNGIDLPGSATINIPNVALVGYGVYVNGGTSYRFGAKAKPDGITAVARPAGTTGQYTIFHNIGHVEYTVCVNIKTPNNFLFYVWKEVPSLRTATSCVICIADMSSNLINLAFDITIFGKNAL